jgi:hypothetical protein
VSSISTNTKVAGAIALWLACWASASTGADLTEIWEGSPYRINAVLAVDAPGELADQLAVELPRYLEQRVNTSIGVVWRLETEQATGSLRHQMLDGLDDFTAEEPASDETGARGNREDKRLLLTVRATPWGYELAAREFDRNIERWGPTLRRSTRQREAVAEQLFALAEQAVAPLAQLRPDPKDPRQVTLELRGADLPASGPDFSWAQPGDVFKPLLRKTARDGSLVTGGITDIPWTYVEVAPPVEGASKPVGAIRSIKLRPLGVPRGRTEQIAIGLRADPGDTVLALRSRMEKEKPLIGYEVFAQDMSAQDGGETSLRPLGASNVRGDVQVSPGRSAVQMLYVKSAGLTLAALPIVPGEKPSVEVWVLDDDMRQRAAARLSALKEDIVDLVARRTIFIARIRQQIEAENLDEARKLLASLDELPGQTKYKIDLDREAQLLQSDDMQVQRRIDRLFAETRKALGKFLDPQAVGAVHEEFRQAEEAAKPPANDGQKETG